MKLPPREKRQERYIRYQKRRCERKTAFESEGAARTEGAKHISHGHIGALWVYHCIMCLKWHLTSKDNGPKAAVHFVATPHRG